MDNQRQTRGRGVNPTDARRFFVLLRDHFLSTPLLSEIHEIEDEVVLRRQFILKCRDLLEQPEEMRQIETDGGFLKTPHAVLYLKWVVFNNEEEWSCRGFGDKCYEGDEATYPEGAAKEMMALLQHGQPVVCYIGHNVLVPKKKEKKTKKKITGLMTAKVTTKAEAKDEWKEVGHCWIGILWKDVNGHLHFALKDSQEFFLVEGVKASVSSYCHIMASEWKIPKVRLLATSLADRSASEDCYGLALLALVDVMDGFSKGFNYQAPDQFKLVDVEARKLKEPLETSAVGLDDEPSTSAGLIEQNRQGKMIKPKKCFDPLMPVLSPMVVDANWKPLYDELPILKLERCDSIKHTATGAIINEDWLDDDGLDFIQQLQSIPVGPTNLSVSSTVDSQGNDGLDFSEHDLTNLERMTISSASVVEDAMEVESAPSSGRMDHSGSDEEDLTLVTVEVPSKVVNSKPNLVGTKSTTPKQQITEEGILRFANEPGASTSFAGMPGPFVNQIAKQKKAGRIASNPVQSNGKAKQKRSFELICIHPECERGSHALRDSTALRKHLRRWYILLPGVQNEDVNSYCTVKKIDGQACNHLLAPGSFPSHLQTQHPNLSEEEKTEQIAVALSKKFSLLNFQNKWWIYKFL